MSNPKIDQEKVIRYLLTIGFTLFIFIILFIFLIVSRLVLSDTTPFGEHVITTKNLLDDIEKVEKAASQDSLNQNYTYKQNNAFMKFNYIYVNISDISYKNFNENRSIITLILDKEILSTNTGLYYFKIENVSTLEKGEIIIYDRAYLKIGEFLEFEEEGKIAVFANSETKSVEKIETSEIVGRVFLNQRKWLNVNIRAGFLF